MKIAPGPFREEWCFQCDGSAISVAATASCSQIAVGTVARTGYLLSGEGELIWKSLSLDFEVWSTTISGDGNLVAFGTANKNPANGTIYVFDRARIPVWSCNLGSPVWSLSFSGDGSFLAASCWNNRVHLFKRDGGTFSRLIDFTVAKNSGLYGIKLARNGQVGFVCSYDCGIIAFDLQGNTVGQFQSDVGLYNLALFNQDESVVAGCANGTFVRGNIDALESSTFSTRVTQRPICGVASCCDGEIVACGSFDGRVLLTTSQGNVLWDLETRGEVWSTAMSFDGSLICIGSGDHTVRLVKNFANSSAVKEIIAAEAHVNAEGGTATDAAIQHLNSLYLKFGIVNYGVRHLRRVAEQASGGHRLRQQIEALLHADIACNPNHYHSHYELGHIYIEQQQFEKALEHLQHAAIFPALRSTALRRAAECFSQLRLPTAMRSAFRQAREQHLDNNSKQILFNLADSLEHAGDWVSAKSIYELLVSWDISFRNAWDKLNILNSFAPGYLPDLASVKRDYTGRTTSLLGPESQKDVDPSLKHVLTSRAKEISVDPGAQHAAEQIVRDLLSDERYSVGIRRDLSKLGYDTQLFLKYDYGLPEDEMKKFLETVNAMPFIKTQATKNDPRSLDIGSATGRYPFLLTRLGFQATGIDIEKAAIEYATNNATGPARPRFLCGDARTLDLHLATGDQFHLITCMMGTFDHIEMAQQLPVLKAMRRRLVDGGVAIVSVWDTECQHLAYLSMYPEQQKEMIRRNSPTQILLKERMQLAGFDHVEIQPFCLLPQVVIYDLGIEQMSAPDILVATMADLTARVLHKELHGEMYLAIGHAGSTNNDNE